MPSTPTPACPCGAACTKRWPGPLPDAATAARSSRRTSSRRDVPEPAYKYAVTAAREASAVSAHGEALELCRRAVRNLPAQLAALDQAALFVTLGDEAAATDDNIAAARAYQTAHELTASVR